MKRFLQILAGIGPLILSLIPETAPFAGAIADAIGQVEAIPGATGPQKKAAALQIVTDGMTVANTVTGRVIADPPTLAGIVSQGIDTTVAAVNLIQQKHP